jgi:phosphorylcholine metabolism protein LicD
MFTFSSLKRLIILLKKNNIRYWIFGGIALEGLRGMITRKHDDIDIYIHKKDLKRFLNILYSKSHAIIKRKKMYFVKDKKLSLGIIVMTEDKRYYVSNGNKTYAKYPKTIFKKDKIANIKGTEFRIVPIEILVFETKYSDHKSDRLFASRLRYDKDLLKKIKYKTFIF